MGGLQIGEAIAAIGALGTAAFGLVDALKALWGGPSRFGFGYISDTLKPFASGFTIISADMFFATLRANWINGVAGDDQKAKAKALIHLELTATGAAGLAAATGVNPAALTAAAQKIDSGAALSPNDISIVGRFDAVVSAKLDCAYEQADQAYRNATKLLAGLLAVILSVSANASLGDDRINWWLAILIGLIATPLAPIVKDLTSSLAAAKTALSVAKK